MTQDHDYIKCPQCGLILGHLDKNVVWDYEKFSKRLYSIGGSLLLACLNCGSVMFDPSKINKINYRDMSVVTSKLVPPKD